MELLTHRCLSSIYELAMILEMALNVEVGMKRIFSISISMEYDLDLPTGTIVFCPAHFSS